MKKKNQLRSSIISFNEFIDIITEGRGEEIKRELKKLDSSKKKD